MSDDEIYAQLTYVTAGFEFNNANNNLEHFLLQDVRG